MGTSKKEYKYKHIVWKINSKGLWYIGLNKDYFRWNNRFTIKFSFMQQISLELLNVRCRCWFWGLFRKCEIDIFRDEIINMGKTLEKIKKIF